MTPARRIALAAALAGAAALLAPALADEEPQIFLEGQETFAVSDPPCELTRPDKDWVFIDIAKQKAELLKTRSPSDVEAEFSTLRARLFNYSTKALLSVHANPMPSGPPPTSDSLVEALKADVARRKNAELISVGAARFAGADAAAVVDWAAKVDAQAAVGARESGPKESDIWIYRRVDIVRPKAQKVLLLLFEVRKERWKKAEPGLSKALKKLKLL